MQDEQRDKPEEESSRESFTVKEKVIFDGNCEHYWEPIGKDPEGVNEAACKKCPHGRRYTDEYECRDGAIVKR